VSTHELPPYRPEDGYRVLEDRGPGLHLTRRLRALPKPLLVLFLCLLALALGLTLGGGIHPPLPPPTPTPLPTMTPIPQSTATPVVEANTAMLLYLRERLTRDEGLSIREVSVLTTSIAIEFEESPPVNRVSPLQPVDQVAHLLDILGRSDKPFAKVLLVGVDYRTHERNLLLVYTGETVRAYNWYGMSEREIANNAIQAITPWWWSR
jgi:hypothetical protein